jgi:hypothetical protein
VVRLLIFFVSNLVFQFSCSEQSSFQKKEMTYNIFESCMETFLDEIKCKEMQDKSEKKSVTPPSANTETRNLYIRQELNDLLDTKSKLYVLELLGEPEDKSIDGGGKEYFIYSRPITKYSQKSSPDKQIIVIFKRGQVTKVLHK